MGLAQGIPITAATGILDSPDELFSRAFISATGMADTGIVAPSTISPVSCDSVISAAKNGKKNEKPDPKQKQPPGQDVQWDKKRKRWTDKDWVYNWDENPHKKRGGSPHWDRGPRKGGRGEWSPDGISWYPK